MWRASRRPCPHSPGSRAFRCGCPPPQLSEGMAAPVGWIPLTFGCPAARLTHTCTRALGLQLRSFVLSARQRYRRGVVLRSIEAG